MWKKSGSENKWKLGNLMKLPEKNRLLIFVLLGVLLVVIAMPSPAEEGEDAPKSGQEGGSLSDAEDPYKAYEEALEQKLEKVLGQVEGVGKLDVMITFRTTGERVVEKDIQSSSQTVEEEDAQGGVRTTKDRSESQTSVYADNSDGGRDPYVKKELTPEVEGILITADGGDDPVVVQDITEAAQALFGVEAHKIKIMKRES